MRLFEPVSYPVTMDQMLQSLPSECITAVLQGLAVTDWISLGCTSKYFAQLVKDDELWHALAVRKWGARVDELATVAQGGWRDWCRHRMSSVGAPPASPLGLLQEQFPDPWAHIACCILCTRTTGGPAVRGAIIKALARWPSPSAILDAPEAELAEAINPLGLQAVRLRALHNMSRDFLATEWELPSEFAGCGKFVSDSFLIFCRGLRSSARVEDTNLQRYLRWLAKGDGGIAKPDGRQRHGRAATTGEAVKKRRVDRSERCTWASKRGTVQRGGNTRAGPTTRSRGAGAC